MQAKPNPLPVDEDARNDWGILVLLTGDAHQRPWSVDELILERGDELAARDSISRLQRGGLIHRTSDDFVWATRAALYCVEIRA